jgi:heat shock protein HtpX
MSQATQLSGANLRRMPIVSPRGVLVDVREMSHSNRLVEHRKMRQTWAQTFIGFVGLSVMIAGAAWWFGGVTILGLFGVLWFLVLGASWFFSSRIAPLAVQAYAADPSTPEGAAAIRCADRAWDKLIKYVRTYHGESFVKLLRRPPVMLSPNKHANAFCTGRDWNDSVIVMFEGLFASGMDDDEIVAVLCHELGHYYHLDVFTQSVASILGAVLSLTVASSAKGAVSKFFTRLPKWLRWFSFVSYIALFFSLRVTGLFVKVVQMFISRSREASADAFSAEITDDPCALARALKKLVNYETELAKKQAAEEAAARESDPVKFQAMQMLRLCEEAVLDSLGLMLFIDTLETLEHASKPAAESWLAKEWERLMENHPPVEDRCAWLELAAGQACPLPGESK